MANLQTRFPMCDFSEFNYEEYCNVRKSKRRGYTYLHKYVELHSKH